MIYAANMNSVIVYTTIVVSNALGPSEHICFSKLTIIGSDNDLSPTRHQAIIWTNDRMLLIRTLGTKSSEILSEIHTVLFKKLH